MTQSTLTRGLAFPHIFTLNGTMRWNLTRDSLDCNIRLGPDGTLYATSAPSGAAHAPSAKR